jgi:hypothetical protein
VKYRKGCDALLGFIIGSASGVVQFWMLSKFVGSVISGNLNTNAVLFAVSQFLLPLITLLSCGLLISQSLLWAGIGMAASLIVGSIIKFLSGYKK